MIRHQVFCPHHTHIRYRLSSLQEKSLAPPRIHLIWTGLIRPSSMASVHEERLNRTVSTGMRYARSFRDM